MADFPGDLCQARGSNDVNYLFQLSLRNEKIHEYRFSYIFVQNSAQNGLARFRIYHVYHEMSSICK